MIESLIQPLEVHHAEKVKSVARSRKSSKNMKAHLKNSDGFEVIALSKFSP
jgi:hypothetical protein